MWDAIREIFSATISCLGTGMIILLQNNRPFSWPGLTVEIVLIITAWFDFSVWLQKSSLWKQTAGRLPTNDWYSLFYKQIDLILFSFY